MTQGIVDHNTLRLAVEGYPRRQSYEPGDTVEVCCSSRAARFGATVVRVGASRVPVWHEADIVGAERVVPPDASVNGCDWPVTFTIPVDPEWRSGFYEVELRAHGVDGPEAMSHTFFVVRAAPGAAAPALLVLATNTYNAYNMWGGTCLYRGATTLSFQRPIDRGFVTRPDAGYDGRNASIDPAGDPTHRHLLDYLQLHRYPLWCVSSGWHNWERRFAHWAETAGFAVDFAVSSDLENRPEIVDSYALVLSVGHDEYWSWEMRDCIDAYVAAGGNHAIFSGNTCFWQVRLTNDGQTMTCFKGQVSSDPVLGTGDDRLRTSFWSDPAIGRPETYTTGLTFTRGGYARVGAATPRSSGAFTVQRPDHWAFAGTDLRYGDALGLGSYIVGYEVDGCEMRLEHGLPVPTGGDGAPLDMEILATAPARLLSQTQTASEIPHALWADPTGPGDLESLAVGLFGSDAPEHTRRIAHGAAVIGCFRRGKGTVFHAGTTDWAYGLDADPLVQQVTANVLRRLTPEDG